MERHVEAEGGQIEAGRTRQRWLVTGCAGFIGSHVAGMLLEMGHEVVGVDLLNRAYDPRLKQRRLERLLARPGFSFRRLDIADREGLTRQFEGAAADRPYAAVVHLAALAGVRSSVDNPWEYYRVNCEGTLNLLELCRRFGVRKFVLASTSSVYGADNPVPYREDARTDRPLSPYAASKKAAETLAFTYHHLHGLDVSVVRYFTVYGPAGRPDMAMFRFIRRIAEGEPIVVYGDGGQRRDFTFVEDIARGTVAALKPLGYEIVNLGNDLPVPLSEVIDHIAALVGRPVKVVRRPAHPADVALTWADLTKARRLLLWSPEVAWQEGVRRTVEWYRANRDFVRSLDLGEE